MSIIAAQWAWTQENLRPARKLVLLSLADRAGPRHTCWPSLARLAVDTGLNPKTIRAALADLCAAGLITREATPGRSHTYTLCQVEPWLSERAAAREAERNGRFAPRPASADIAGLTLQGRGGLLSQAAASGPPGETAPPGAIHLPGEAAPAQEALLPVPDSPPAQNPPPCQNPLPGPAENTPCPRRFRQGRGAGNGGPTNQEPDSNQGKNRKALPGPRKLPFGRFGNVLLTPEEHGQLTAEHGERGARAIDKLDLWLGAHGDRYKSHYMAIHAWALRAVDEDDARAARLALSAGPGPALAPAASPHPAALAQGPVPAILPTTYAHLERANQKSVARLALLGRGVYAHGQQTRHHHGIDLDPDPVQPPRG